MLKARGGNTVLIGLSDENFRRLKFGQPILFDGADVGLPGMRFVVIHGVTEQAMEDELIQCGIYIPQ